MKLTTDKAGLYRHFQKNPVLYSYLIGDLDDFYFPLCTWPVIENEEGDIEDAVLLYNNPRFVCVQAFGQTDRFEQLLTETLPHLPDRFYCHYLKPYRDLFRQSFEEKPLSTHIKMKLKNFTPHHSEDENLRRLSMDDFDAIIDLYEAAYPDRYFDERLLATGKFFGISAGPAIIAVAGVHVYSKEYDIAVLGSIATHPDYRGRGLATRVTSRLIQELQQSVGLIALNVQHHNVPAIRCYEKLGFIKHCEYEEALFERRIP
ncbi:MAG: GNAT family N-acetyltransferase [Candidatus Zixiibacteriota bacterium]